MNKLGKTFSLLTDIWTEWNQYIDMNRLTEHKTNQYAKSNWKCKTKKQQTIFFCKFFNIFLTDWMWHKFNFLEGTADLNWIYILHDPL